MCDPITVALTAAAAGSVLGAGGAIVSGVQQKKAADYQANQAEADAEAAKSAARVEAARIRKAGEAQAAQANAGYAASGVETGSGTALRITSGIVGDVEEDAYQTILNGVNQSSRLNSQAQADRISGNNALTSGVIKGTGSLLEGGSKAYSGWITYKDKQK